MSKPQARSATFRHVRRISAAAALVVAIGGLLVWKLAPSLSTGQVHPQIAVRFTTTEPGYVTLVVERNSTNTTEQGRRVKNLISGTWYPAGEHTVWWDGLDESNTQTVLIPRVAQYEHIIGSMVTPGEYRVRGLVRQAIAPKYEFSVYSGDQSPPWDTRSNRGGWLADHTPPSAALYLPGTSGTEPRVLLSSSVAEAGEGLVWTDLSGKRVAGTRGLGAGEGWGGAELLARDVAGPRAGSKTYAYLAGMWFQRAEVWEIGGNRKLYAYPFDRSEDAAVGGLAVRDGLLALSLPKVNEVQFIDATSGNLLGRAAMTQPRGLAFDGAGRLLALSGRQLAAWDVVRSDAGVQLRRAGQPFAASFEDPQGITLDDRGQIYVSDWGQSQQVKVLSPEGRLVRTIGSAGPPRVGPYDERHMDRPKGLTVTSDGRLWVAENSLVPKRVSIWTLEGDFVKGLYGPTWYGGGGSLDPHDRTRFFTHGGGGGMEFRLDWEHGTSTLTNVYYRADEGGIVLPGGFPQTPVWVDDRLYLSNAFANGPTNGEQAITIWRYRDEVVVPVAAVGDAATWDLLKTDPYRKLWPAGVDMTATKAGQATFAWSDLNGDGTPQPNEVQIVAGAPPGYFTLDGELGVTTSTAVRYLPTSFTSGGAPIYDLARGTTLAPGGRSPSADGGGQVIAAKDGWTVFAWPPAPLTGAYVAGTKNGRIDWTYPDEFLGLHNAALAKPPQREGEVIGTTRLLGRTVTAGGVELWAINGDYGNVYLFTTDGLLVATLFKDQRVARPLPAVEQRGADLNDISLAQECFFPSIQQMTDGHVYLIGGQPYAGIFEITGLSSIRRLPAQRLTITAADVAAARRFVASRSPEPPPPSAPFKKPPEPAPASAPVKSPEVPPANAPITKP